MADPGGGASRFSICGTCAVEYADPLPAVCPICRDERQWVPATGQRWTTLEDLQREGQKLTWSEGEPGRFVLSCDPGVGIGQRTQVIATEQGTLLWDPVGYIDDAAVKWIRGLGPVLGIASSHPHMFGVQVEWAHALDAPIFVNEADAQWLGRHDALIRFWSGEERLGPISRRHRRTDAGAQPASDRRPLRGQCRRGLAGGCRRTRHSALRRHRLPQPRRMVGRVPAQLPQQDPALGSGRAARCRRSGTSSVRCRHRKLRQSDRERRCRVHPALRRATHRLGSRGLRRPHVSGAPTVGTTVRRPCRRGTQSLVPPSRLASLAPQGAIARVPLEGVEPDSA